MLQVVIYVIKVENAQKQAASIILCCAQLLLFFIFLNSNKLLLLRRINYLFSFFCFFLFKLCKNDALENIYFDAQFIKLA